jgi:hypothetical protein
LVGWIARIGAGVTVRFRLRALSEAERA